MTPIALVPASPHPPAALLRETVVHRLTLRGVPWALYDQLLAVVGNGLPRMTYDRGLLELEMPSKTHETLKWLAGRFVEAYAEESGIDYDAAGSTTWRSAAIEGGLEADESYYFQNYSRVRGREVDLAVDPPPDLAIEIDLSPPDVEKTSVYARLGVPEIWRWRDGQLVVLERQSHGDYVERQKSLALPDFPLNELAIVLGGYPATDPRAFCRAISPPGARKIHMNAITRLRAVSSLRPRTSARPACAEAMEARLMLSGYGFSSVWSVKETGVPSDGSIVVRDSAGNLYGTTVDGGVNNAGVVYEIAKGSGKITTLASFPGLDLGTGGSNLTIDSAGNLYGVNDEAYSIFEVVKGSGKITTLTSSAYHDPSTDLIVDSNGNLYWASQNEGIFELPKGSSVVTTLSNYRPADSITSNLARDAAGNLYGTTEPQVTNAGTSTAFELPFGSTKVTTLATFSSPVFLSAPIVDSSGNLYGTSYTTGQAGTQSTVFEVAKGSGTVTTLATFSSEVVLSSLVRKSSGDLYGTASEALDGSTVPIIFKVANGSGKVTTLATFAANSIPSALMLDSAGNLYGTALGGSNTVFELAFGTHSVTALATFGGLNNPTGMVSDSAGNLYGVANQDGQNVYSLFPGNLYGIPYQEGQIVYTIFKVATNGVTSTLATIDAGPQGLVPSGLILDSSGDLFGTLTPANPTLGKVTYDSTIFEVVKGSGKTSTVATFGNNLAASGLDMDSKGNLYGTLVDLQSETGPKPTVFEVAKGSTKVTTLATFSTYVAPSALVVDTAGDLFGTAYDPSGHTNPTVFEVVIGSGKIKTLVTFSNGGVPSALVLDSSGNLYGTLNFFTGGYPSSPNTVFEVVKGSGKITTLATFDTGIPIGVIVDSSGNLFGAAPDENYPFEGFVYEVVKGSGNITTILTLSSSTGSPPASQVLLGPGGTLFGSTAGGGPLGGGVVFKLSPK